MNDGEPSSAHAHSNSCAPEHLGQSVVPQDDASHAHCRGGSEQSQGECGLPKPAGVAAAAGLESDEDEEEAVGREESHELRVTRRQSVLAVVCRREASSRPLNAEVVSERKRTGQGGAGLLEPVLEQIVEQFVAKLAHEETDLKAGSLGDTAEDVVLQLLRTECRSRRKSTSVAKPTSMASGARLLTAKARETGSPKSGRCMWLKR